LTALRPQLRGKLGLDPSRGSFEATAGFIVDYHGLGRIDLGLGFTLLQVPYTNQPLSQSEHSFLVWSDTHSELSDSGQLRPLKGTAEWRIKTGPRVPHVSVTATMS